MFNCNVNLIDHSLGLTCQMSLIVLEPDSIVVKEVYTICIIQNLNFMIERNN